MDARIEGQALDVAWRSDNQPTEGLSTIRAADAHKNRGGFSLGSLPAQDAVLDDLEQSM
jgi:hypothetical protein